jgi:hypothetical protein
MASPPIPPSLEQLTTRPFSFYPPILNVEHNEWLFRKATWAELLVINCKSGAEVWISRRFIGEISRIDDPVVIVGLTKELEYKAGSVFPYQRRVIEMPLAVGGGFPHTGATDTPLPSRGVSNISIRLESSDKRIVKLIAGVLAFGILLYVIVVNLNRVGELRQSKVVFTTRDQSYMDLTGRDDYLAVVQKLGQPSSDRWQNETGAIQYRALTYPDRKYTVILMGTERANAHYIGALDESWNPVHSVEIRSGGSTASLLRALKHF